MKTAKELAKEYCDEKGYNGYYTRNNLIHAYIDGYNKANEWMHIKDMEPNSDKNYISRYPSRHGDDFDWYYEVNDMSKETTHWRYVD